MTDLQDTARELVVEAIPTGPQGYCSLHVDEISALAIDALAPVWDVATDARKLIEILGNLADHEEWHECHLMTPCEKWDAINGRSLDLMRNIRASLDKLTKGPDA